MTFADFQLVSGRKNFFFGENQIDGKVKTPEIESEKKLAETCCVSFEKD